ncbi:hypothetical protein [Chamaesiphon polymorphus]|uniref:Uncharacterized protein n=1 Tax=Chamaesiphon polymorphus CCALA 037 TaxID=2107692 RepID=A0A2T1GFD5_9CYAN|nr:hypothetical protein [Chamaesiphon polymorphus]PSB56324.1 hypothetical protein C7B77_12275 [Chamaesiphon polymorphus CCALA 037]
MKYQLAITIAIVSLIGVHVPSMAESIIFPAGSKFQSRWLQAQQPNNLVTFPEVGLALPQPSGFTKATAFHGFEQTETNSSIVLTKIPGPFSGVTKGFDKDTLATRGISLISKESIKINNQPGLLLQISQSAYGEKFLKWVLIFGDEKNTSVATATFLDKNTAKFSEPLKQTLLAVTPSLSSDTSAVSSLPFSITAVEGLAPVAAATGLGKVAAFTKDGNLPVTNPTDPLFIVTPSVAIVPIGDRKSFATRRLSNYPQTDITRVTSTKKVSIDNIPGWEIVANGRDRQSKSALKLYQIVLFPERGGYIVLIGIVGDKQSETYLPKFKAMALTYRNSPQ